MDTDLVVIEGKVYEDFPIVNSEESLCTVEVVCSGNLSQMTFPAVNLNVLIDASGSMATVISEIHATLMALGNSLREWKDRKVTLTLITFNTEANVVFSGSLASEVEYKEFEAAVSSIKADGYTNIGEALTLAAQKYRGGTLNSLILLSDGNPNTGITDIDKLTEHRNSLFPQMDVVTIGYGTNYNPQILANLGRFTYAPSCEEIPGIIGSYIGQVMTTFGIGAKLDVGSFHENQREVIGSLNMGTLFADRVYYLSVSVPKDSLESIIGKTLTLTYDTFDKSGCLYQVTVSSLFNDNREDKIPDNISKLYYESSAGRLINSFKNLNRKGQSTTKNCNFIRQRVKLWDDVLGKESRNRVLIAIGDIAGSRDFSYHSTSFESSSSNQIGYGRDTNFQTPQQCRSSARSTNIYNTIISQPDMSEHLDTTPPNFSF